MFPNSRPNSQFTGSLPDGRSPLPYTFSFYPLNKPAVKIVDIKGNLFVPPHILRVPFKEPNVLTGNVILRIETDATNRRFIVTDVDSKTPDGTVYKGKYYLFTLPPYVSHYRTVFHWLILSLQPPVEDQ